MTRVRKLTYSYILDRGEGTEPGMVRAELRLFDAGRHVHLWRFLSTSTPAAKTNSSSSSPSSSSPLKKAINSLFKERDVDRLVALFKSSASHPRFRRRHSVHEVAVRRLALHRRFDAVAEVLETLKCYPTDIAREGFAVRIITLYGRAGMPDHAAATFRDLPSLGCPVTVMSFNAVLSAFVDSNFPSRAVEMFTLPPQGVVPDAFSYNILVHALCDLNEVDSAFGTLRMMEENGIRPDLITYNTLLRGCYRTGCSIEEVDEKVWSLMEEKGCCVPDVRSFNEKLIAMVDRLMATVQVLKVFEEMGRRGLRPNTYSFNALIKGCVGDGSVEDAKRYLKELKAAGCLPNAGTFEALLPGLCEAGELDLAFRLSKKSMAHLVEVNVLQRVVDVLVKASKLEEAKRLVELGSSRDCYRESLRMPTTL